MANRWRCPGLILAPLLFLLCFGAEASRPVWLLTIEGAIGPASADYFDRGLQQATQGKAQLVILQMDTPGGLDSSMRQIIKSILDADIPIVSYVGPEGARAASAGTYILYASHIAAMAPATNVGAATPVQIGTPSLPGTDDSKEKDKGKNQGTAMERKIINDAEAYIDGLARLRKRNNVWAKKAVRDAASLTAEKALKENVIDIIATDIDDLLTQLHGRNVNIDQETYTLDVDKVVPVRYEPDWRNRFLSVITDPNIAYILMLIGIYGMIFEFSNPGMGVPGVVGSVCLLLALYAFQLLPVSYAGLGLIVLGCSLMIAEAFSPSFGILGIGGIIAFVFGSIILMDTDLPEYRIALPVILGVSTASVAMLVLLLGMVIRSRRQLVVSGLGSLEGRYARVEVLHEGQPMVRLDGELWQVSCKVPLAVGDRVHVVTALGVQLSVEKQQGE